MDPVAARVCSRAPARCAGRLPSTGRRRRTRCRGPSPSLCASTAAAVQLDQPLDQRQADAEAALRRGRACVSTCANRSKMRGSSSRRDADAGVAHADHRLARRRRSAASAMCPPARRVLGGVVEQVGEDLRQARRIGRRATSARAAASASSSCPRASISGRLGLDARARATSRQRRRGSRRSSILPWRDARHVEQVVDQAHQLLDLALDDVARLPTRGVAARRAPHDRRARCGSAPADCAARARAWRGTRPCGDRRGAAPPRPACGR